MYPGILWLMLLEIWRGEWKFNYTFKNIFDEPIEQHAPSNYFNKLVSYTTFILNILEYFTSVYILIEGGKFVEKYH